MTIIATFTQQGLPFWAVKIAGDFAEIEPIYAQVADVANGDSRTGPKVTVQKSDGSEVEVELRTIVDSKVGGDHAEVVFGFSKV